MTEIKVQHYKSEEDTENGKIKHDFVCFDAGGVEINNISAAKDLAKQMGEKVFPYLQETLEGMKGEAERQKCEKTVAWVHKKAVWHPELVEKCTHQLLEKMENSEALKEIPLSYNRYGLILQ